MKKLISILLAAIMIAGAALLLTACGKSDPVTVTSVLTLNDAFRGTRVVTVKYPLSTQIDTVKDAIMAGEPSSKAEGVTFTYKGVEDDGYTFELTLDFYDREDYEREAAAVINRTASSYLSRKDTVLTDGTRMKENFGADDLIAWIVRATAEDASTRDLEFSYDSNTVVIGDKTYSTGTTVDISEVTGSTVTSISIKTVNDKQGTFSRTFEFVIPNSDYLAAKDDIEQYFLTNTAPAAKYSGWSPDGTGMVYQVIFEGLTIRDLRQYTSMLLDTDSVNVSYQNVDSTSTPLSEGLAFDESLDTFSFIGPDQGAPMLYYSYVLPSNTIHGDGAVFEDGKWSPAGSWQDGAYNVELSSGSVHLRVPDGVQYAVEGINFYLDSLGSERFRRTVNFLYSKDDGAAGRDYAVKYFRGKEAAAEATEDDRSLICSVVCEGTASELTAELVRLFGTGNEVTYRKNSGAFSLTTKTTFTDSIDLSAILNSANVKQPMNYYISASGAENIVSVLADGGEQIYRSADESAVSVTGGVSAVGYYGSLPITSHIIIYIIFGLLLLGATIFGAYMMMHRRRRKLSAGAQKIADAVGLTDDEMPASLTQTTTFSIAELGALSRNKRYVDEINKDIEERIENDRLTRRKEEIRRRELAEMERKVYGTTDDSAVEEVPELDISVLKAAVAQTADDAAQPDPAPEAAPAPEQPAEKTDPFSLLDETEDESDEV